jgi:tetraacyldisaccharide 4'-kinase
VSGLSTWRKLLWPFSVLYSGAARLRIWTYARGLSKTRKLPGTVISVGNLTVGGTGKTPMVLWLAERFSQEGKHVAILTRGYKGSVDGNNRGEPQSDEVALLRERLSGKVQIGVGANRFETGEILARHGTDWFVLDDGFQHVRLSRDVDIVLVDATDPFGGGMTLPAGWLREPVSALARADLVVVTRSVQAPASALEKVIRRHSQSPIFYATTQIQSVLRIPELTEALPIQDWRKLRFMAFCGIGNPPAFFDDLRNWNFQLAGVRAFPDHHVYTAREVADLEHEAAICHADALLCTEKDVWNLRNAQFNGLPAYCCRITMALSEGFRDAIGEAMRRNKMAAAK